MEKLEEAGAYIKGVRSYVAAADPGAISIELINYGLNKALFLIQQAIGERSNLDATHKKEYADRWNSPLVNPPMTGEDE